MSSSISIGLYRLGPGHPCFIIAEAGVNHDGDVDQARRLVEVAAKAGANAVKFQTFEADKLVSVKAPKADYQKTTTASAESQYEMLARLQLDADAHCELVAHCRKVGIVFLSSPFDEFSADFLEEIGVSAFKVGSGELTNLPLLAHIARKGKPMVVSTGMATLEEVETAVQVVTDEGSSDLVLLHCVSNYPARAKDVNLRAMATMQTAFGVPVGYSDHVLGNEVAFAAVALGACIIEKHFTLDRNLPGPDHRASLEPDELGALVAGIRVVESCLGDGRKQPAPSEIEIAAVARKSLVASRDIAKGTTLERSHITIKRPGTGLPPNMLSHVLGRKTNTHLAKDALLRLEDLE